MTKSMTYQSSELICVRRKISVKILDETSKKSYGKPECQAQFWNGKARLLVSACDAVVKDLEHFVFKVNIYVSNTNHIIPQPQPTNFL